MSAGDPNAQAGEGEDALFDDSANPSQKPDAEPARRKPAGKEGKQSDHADKPEQAGEVIPEEEQQPS